MKAKYRRIFWYTTRIAFQYKLAGHWFWREGSVGVGGVEDYDDAENAVKRWLEFHSREGVV